MTVDCGLVLAAYHGQGDVIETPVGDNVEGDEELGQEA